MPQWVFSTYQEADDFGDAHVIAVDLCRPEPNCDAMAPGCLMKYTGVVYEMSPTEFFPVWYYDHEFCTPAACCPSAIGYGYYADPLCTNAPLTYEVPCYATPPCNPENFCDFVYDSCAFWLNGFDPDDWYAIYRLDSETECLQP